MKVILVLLFLIPCLIHSQIKKPVTKKCYEKEETKTNNRFSSWECGKTAGVVDCNEKLEYDERNKVFLSSSGGMPYSGKCETCFENGVRERLISFVNGKENGVDTTKYISGCPMVIRNHINGFENGKWTYFYDSTNNMAWEMNYLVGQKHGKHVYFSPEGDTTLLENYQYDILHGKKRNYFNNGKVRRSANYENGKLNGFFITYNKEGKELERLSYLKGKKNGPQMYYYDDGKLLKVENWTEDIKNGSFTTYFYQGNIQNLENYKRGIKNGLFEVYYPTGKIKMRSNYKKGKLLLEIEYNEKGKEIRRFPELEVQENQNEDDDIELKEEGKKKRRK